MGYRQPGNIPGRLYDSRLAEGLLDALKHILGYVPLGGGISPPVLDECEAVMGYHAFRQG